MSEQVNKIEAVLLDQSQEWWASFTNAVNSDDAIRRMAPLLSSLGLTVSDDAGRVEKARELAKQATTAKVKFLHGESPTAEDMEQWQDSLEELRRLFIRDAVLSSAPTEELDVDSQSAYEEWWETRGQKEWHQNKQPSALAEKAWAAGVEFGKSAPTAPVASQEAAQQPTAVKPPDVEKWADYLMGYDGPVTAISPELLEAAQQPTPDATSKNWEDNEPVHSPDCVCGECQPTPDAASTCKDSLQVPDAGGDAGFEAAVAAENTPAGETFKKWLPDYFSGDQAEAAEMAWSAALASAQSRIDASLNEYLRVVKSAGEEIATLKSRIDALTRELDEAVRAREEVVGKVREVREQIRKLYVYPHPGGWSLVDNTQVLEALASAFPEAGGKEGKVNGR